MEAPHYVVGIDLGTSNCAVAFASLANGPEARVLDLAIPQLQRFGGVGEQLLLPSALYIPTSEEAASGGLKLPWADGTGWVIGQLARSHGTRVPSRLITSAKSWLCHPAVDRTASILPWGSPSEIPKLSPVQASSLLLEHIRQAWDHLHPEAPLSVQQVIVTVPASFDEVARALTVNAIRAAKLENFTLIEEPQAAFYDFTSRQKTSLAATLKDVRLILVVDVGGGTSDFTLVQVSAGEGLPALRRIAVGDHLMLGGDNMDAALARRIEEQFKNKKLSPIQWTQLVLSARDAKERLLGPNPPPEVKIALAGEGSKLLGGTLSATVSLAATTEIILEGFFPRNRADEAPPRANKGGIQELGLPYVADPAITKHIAAFLRRHSAAAFEALGQGEGSADALPRPDAILLNGGVFNSEALAKRLVEVLSSWWPARSPIPLLEHDSLDLAVARGAAYYGLVRQGWGQKISGGTAHAFYVGLAAKKDAAAQAVCLIPRGFEEGQDVELKDRAFNLTVGRPVQFPFLTTTSDRIDRAGDIITITEELDPLPPIHTVLQTAGDKLTKIPVYLRARLTEIGTVELWCVSQESREQWRLEFELRGAISTPDLFVTEAIPPQLATARRMVEAIYGGKAQAKALAADKDLPQNPKQLWSSLEKVLGARESWSAAVLRELWGVLYAGAARRRKSPDHERIYFQLLGYTLRPGFGYPLDEWRCEQGFKLFPELIEAHKEKPNWSEFWICWRRISGGLSDPAETQLWEYLKPNLQLRVPPKPRNVTRPKGPQPEGLDEMVRCGASLENLPVAEKILFGELILEKLRETRPPGGPWAWALGRLGARVPFYGSAHNVLSPLQAEAWIDSLLALDPSKLEGAPFALAQMARASGDRVREISESTRGKVLAKLEELQCSKSWLRFIREVVVMEAPDEARALGDTLPAGLQLAS
jgi:hypothetical protein